MKNILLALCLGLAMCGCVRLSEQGFDRTRYAADVGRNAMIRLSDYTSFDWTRVHVFAPYTPASVIRDEVGRRVPFPHGSSESHCLLVFMSGDKISAAFEIERSQADFSRLFRKAGYSRDEAVFAIEVRSADQRRFLTHKAG
jgi:hypothetical protein